jgi:RNA polymerase primary sigma factor
MAKTAVATGTPAIKPPPGKSVSDPPLQELISSSPSLKRLLAQARERGVVTHDEINAALPEDDDAPDQLMDQLLLMFDEMGVSVGGDEDGSGANGVAKTDLEGEGDETEGPAAIDEEDLGRTDDPVRMYLREMGTIELLSREGEIEIAKRIEAGATRCSRRCARAR